MKVGIDGVLLGAWTPVGNARKMLDVGCGTGLIALMLAQRSEAEIMCIDIDEKVILQATENIKNSPWSNRIAVLQNSFQDFANISSERFDLIVSNPPYFVNSLKAPDESRTTARHADSLTHEELIENALKLLNPNGRICLILPVVEALQCIQFAESNGMCCSKQVTVFPKPGAQAKRFLLEFSQIQQEKTETELTIESEIRHHYSPDFIELAKDFYLKL